MSFHDESVSSVPVELEVDEHRQGARVGLAVVGLDRLAVVQTSSSAAQAGAGEGRSSEERGEALHAPADAARASAADKRGQARESQAQSRPE